MPSRRPLPLFIFLLSSLCSLQLAHPLSDQLFLQFLPPNQAASALTPPSILFGETPIVIRYTLIGGIAIYEPQAACHPTALSFFGKRDPIPRALCDEEVNAQIRVFTVYHALVNEFPAEMSGFRQFLESLGLKLDGANPSTPQGWARRNGRRLARFFARDEWNALGKRNTDIPSFRQPFQDYTGYRPRNCPADQPTALPFPLRWQPFTSTLDGRGRFVSQVHVVPQIAQASTLVLNASEAGKPSRRPSAPYQRPDAQGSIAAGDRKRLRELTAQLIRTSRELTSQQRFLAEWWNNKLFSTAAISAFYERAGGLSRFEIAQQFMGEMLAQYDALVMTWREKRRHDLARPRTLLRQVRKGERFRAFISEGVGGGSGVGTVRAEEWRPLIGEQAHSEFPSGSAAVCQAAMEHINAYVRDKVGPGRRVPPIKIRFPETAFPFSKRAMTVSYRGPLDAALSCAESRLWAGVHFQPAVDAGLAIGKGVGEIVFQHIKDLGNGVVPKGCGIRCSRRW